jgi:hypothetical protein
VSEAGNQKQATRDGVKSLDSSARTGGQCNVTALAYAGTAKWVTRTSNIDIESPTEFQPNEFICIITAALVMFTGYSHMTLYSLVDHV